MAELLLHGSQYLENPAANDLLVLGFQNIVAGMELNALVGIGKIRIGGEQDHIAVRCQLPDLPCQLQAAHIRHPNVGNQQ